MAKSSPDLVFRGRERQFEHGKSFRTVLPAGEILPETGKERVYLGLVSVLQVSSIEVILPQSIRRGGKRRPRL